MSIISLLQDNAQKAKATQVVTTVRGTIRVKNYFGWRSFIDEVSDDIVGYMIKTEFKYSAGAYITCGMQAALDKCRYCNAQKRRGDYETCSIDELYSVASPEKSPMAKLLEQENCKELYEGIRARYGKEVADKLKPVIYGEEDKVESKILKQCRTQEFKEFVQDFSL